MSWEVATAWIKEIVDRHRVLGIWRAQQGPGPWSIFMQHEQGLLEIWASPGPQLYGKVIPTNRDHSVLTSTLY